MQIHYDEQANAISVRFRTGRSVRTEELPGGLAVDYNRAGKVIAVEILNAKKHLLNGGVKVPDRILRLGL